MKFKVTCLHDKVTFERIKHSMKMTTRMKTNSIWINVKYRYFTIKYFSIHISRLLEN